MTQQDKPLCRYCGQWNGHPDGVEMVLDGLDLGLKAGCAYMRCPVCGSHGPTINDSCKKQEVRKQALAAALHCFHPRQKPLTLEEVKRHIEEGNERPLYIEFNFSAKPNFRDTDFYPLWRGFDNIKALIRHEERYNVEFRFWWERPTEEERAAAKWEEENRCSTCCVSFFRIFGTGSEL